MANGRETGPHHSGAYVSPHSRVHHTRGEKHCESSLACPGKTQCRGAQTKANRAQSGRCFAALSASSDRWMNETSSRSSTLTWGRILRILLCDPVVQLQWKPDFTTWTCPLSDLRPSRSMLNSTRTGITYNSC